MEDFLHAISVGTYQLISCFTFYKKRGIFPLLKILTLLIFIGPAVAFLLLELIAGFINIAICHIFVINWIWALFAGLLAAIATAFFFCVNLFELAEYRAEIANAW